MDSNVCYDKYDFFNSRVDKIEGRDKSMKIGKPKNRVYNRNRGRIRRQINIEFF